MSTSQLSTADRRLVQATQAGLPLVPRPFSVVAAQLGTTEADVVARFRDLDARGVLRRIAAVPDHYKLGYTANGMTVWDIADDHIGAAGTALGQLSYVSHCYQRPRSLPDWPYNLFAMVHGRSRSEVEQKLEAMRALLGDVVGAVDVLYSTRILKKTGLRLQPKEA